MARRLPALSSLLVLCLVTVTWQGRTREGGGLRLDAGRSESWSARELERRNTMVVLRLLGGQPDRVEMLYWNSFKEAPGWNQTAELLGYNRALDDSSVQELAIKLGQLAGNNSELSLKERSQLDQDDLFRLAKNLHINKDEHRAAETLYRMCIRENPRHVGALCNYGVLLEKFKRDATSSESLYRFAREIDPSSAAVKHRLAQSLHVQDKNEEAERMFEEALAADENFLPTLKQYASFLALRSSNFSRAEKMFLRAIEKDPRDVKVVFQFLMFASMRGISVVDRIRSILVKKGDEGSAAIELLDTLASTNSLQIFDMLDLVQNSTTDDKAGMAVQGPDRQLRMLERVIMKEGEDGRG